MSTVTPVHLSIDFHDTFSNLRLIVTTTWPRLFIPQMQ